LVGPQQVARLLTMLGLPAGLGEVRRVLLGAEHKAERRIGFPDLLQVAPDAGWAPVLQRQAARRHRARGRAARKTTVLRPMLSTAAPLQALTGLPRGASGKRELQRAFTYLAGEGLSPGYISTRALGTALACAFQIWNRSFVARPVRSSRQARAAAQGAHCAGGLSEAEAEALAGLPLRLQGAGARPRGAAGPDASEGVVCISDVIDSLVS